MAPGYGKRGKATAIHCCRDTSEAELTIRLCCFSHGLVTQSAVLDSAVCDKDQKTGHSAGLLIDESLKI